MASAHLVSLVHLIQTRPAVPTGRNLVPTAAAGPDCAVKTTPTATAVPADIRSPAVRPPRFRPKPHLKSALAALPQVPAISAVQKLALTAAMYRPAQAVKPEPPCLMPD